MCGGPTEPGDGDKGAGNFLSRLYVLVAIVKKRLGLDVSLYTLLQVFSVTLFEKIPLNKGFFDTTYTSEDAMYSNQLNLFNY